MWSQPAAQEQCHGCKRSIQDRYLLRVGDQSWHEACLQCSLCRQPLLESCFCRDGRFYCKADYDRLYGNKCGACHQAAPPGEPVMRVDCHVYHLSCFTCTACRQRLQTGDPFIMQGSQLFCGAHFEDKVWNDASAKDDLKSYGSNVDEENSNEDKASSDSAAKRARTILTASQRLRLRSAFETTPKPNRKVRESLSDETGLNVRVVQVWFQNQRAKVKKMVRKQADSNNSSSSNNNNNNNNNNNLSSNTKRKLEKLNKKTEERESRKDKMLGKADGFGDFSDTSPIPLSEDNSLSEWERNGQHPNDYLQQDTFQMLNYSVDSLNTVMGLHQLQQFYFTE